MKEYGVGWTRNHAIVEHRSNMTKEEAQEWLERCGPYYQDDSHIFYMIERESSYSLYDRAWNSTMG